MNRFSSLRRIAALMALLGACALTGVRAAADEVPFDLNGTFTVLGNVDNNDFLVAVDGTASPGGYFSEDIVVHGTGNHIQGTPTLVFADGSLTFYYEVKLDHKTGIYEGEFTVLGGTGIFEGATGSGEICYPVNPGVNPWMMSGTLDL